MKRRRGSAGWFAAALVGLGLSAGCGAGVPIQLRLDEMTVDLSVSDALDSVESGLRGRGILPPESTGIPEVWPDELPDVCYDFLVSTDQAGDVGRIDLTPDPEEDPGDAELFAPVNDGTVTRIEIEKLVLRVEKNTLNIPLPPIEVQAADAYDADPDDRRAWYQIGGIGGSLPRGCGSGEATPAAVAPGEVKDLEFVFEKGGESFLNNQLADENCLENQAAAGEEGDPLRCKEFSLRARTRMVLDTAELPVRPRGSARLRLILVATFFVDPL